MTPLLEVEDLHVRYGDAQALTGVSFTLDRGQSLAVAGESGSGKSTLAMCLAGLVRPPAASGRVLLDGEDLLTAAPRRLNELRWARTAVALQSAPFNPVTSVGSQVAEPLRVRAGMTRRQARGRAFELASEVLLDPALLDRYPHQLSGGERRRALLAMVLALDPALVVLDEPTAGLDPSMRRALADQIAQLARDRGFALIAMSHDIPDADRLASQAMVLYAGQMMEAGATADLFRDPAHPYSWALVNAYPLMTTTKDLRPIQGLPPDPRAVPSGCPYHPRCTQAEIVCREERPPLVEAHGRLVRCHFGGRKTQLAAHRLYKTFGSGKARAHALRGVSLRVQEGESVGVIGASGSGKSTLARVLAGQLAADHGRVELEGMVLEASRPRSALQRRRVQLVMQDPWEALSPRLTVTELVREPMDIAAKLTSQERAASVRELLSSVGLPDSGGFLWSRSHELSGGQLQRVALARALAAEPKLLVADEPTSLLDASEQARLLTLLRERQSVMGLGLVLISHDVAVVRKLTDRIVVLDDGRVVEEGPSQLVSTRPHSDAAKRLINDSPVLVPLSSVPAPARPDNEETY